MNTSFAAIFSIANLQPASGPAPFILNSKKNTILGLRLIFSLKLIYFIVKNIFVYINIFTIKIYFIINLIILVYIKIKILIFS
jgi:hypothetical protein